MCVCPVASRKHGLHEVIHHLWHLKAQISFFHIRVLTRAKCISLATAITEEVGVTCPINKTSSYLSFGILLLFLARASTHTGAREATVTEK